MNPESEPSLERTTYQLDKIVRDGKYLSMLDLGQIVETRHPSGRVFSDEELFEAKLIEEMEEFDQARYYYERLKEAADFMAVWDSYLRDVAKKDIEPSLHLGRYLDDLTIKIIKFKIPEYYVRQQQAKAREDYGEFDGKHYVFSVSLLPDDEFNGYYREFPARFPELG